MDCKKRVSVSSVSSSIMDDNDPITRDCFALRQRLLETEKSLQNLTIKSNKLSADMDVSQLSLSSEVEDKESIYQSDNPPVLTLADLTPTNSQLLDFDTNLGDFESEELFTEHTTCELPQNNEMTEENIMRERPSSSRSHRAHDSLNGSDTHVNSLHKKLGRLREENVALFVQNNKLLMQLEQTSFQLQEAKNQINEMSDLMEENEQLKENDFEEKMRNLKEQIENKNYAIRGLEELVIELRNHMKDGGYGEEHNKRLEDKVDQNLKTIEELSESCEGYSQREGKLQNLVQQLEELKTKSETKIMELENDNSMLREENGNVKTDNINLQEQLATLKNELITLQQKSSQLDCLTVQNADIKVIVENQQLKLADYQTEISKTKEHMGHLEKLVQKIQEEKLASSRPGSASGFLNEIDFTKFASEDSNCSSQRAVIADLQLKLAMKDTELHKLQVLVASNAINQQKMRSEFNYEGSTLHDLRAELCCVVEKTRIGDKKQMQLEQQITQLQEDLSGKKCQIIEMNERIQDKISLTTTLENKLLQRNRKLLELQNQIEMTTDKSEKLQSENCKLATELSDESKSTSVNQSKVKQLEERLESANRNASHFESLLKAHEEETKETDIQFDNVKKLHSDHCKEYECQIDNLQQQIYNKANHVVAMETKMRNLLNEEKNKDASILELKEYIGKMEQLLGEKKTVIEKYQENLQSIQEHGKTKSQLVADLQSSLEQYKKELGVVMTTLQESRVQQENIITTKSNEIQTKAKELEELESSNKQYIEMLEQSQKRISELEKSQGRDEEEITQLKQTMEHGKMQSHNELATLGIKFEEKNKELSMCKNKVNNLAEELNVSKTNNLLLTGRMKEHEMKLISQSDIIKKKVGDIEKLNNALSDCERTLALKDVEIKRLEEEIVSRDRSIDVASEAQQQLTAKLHTTQDELNDSLQKLVKLENDMRKKHKLQKDEAMEKLERMIAISQEDLNLKDKELKEFNERTGNMEKLLNGQQWQLKQKMAEFTQLEIAFKNEKSEYEKKIAFMADDITGLKSSISQKDTELLELTRSCEFLKISEASKSNRIEEYEKKFVVVEEENLRMLEEVKHLTEEMERCKAEIKNRIVLEDEINNLHNQTSNMITDVHTLENQLMISQQTVLELNQELADAAHMIKLKEADCTRLARELGASQVREAQESARLNQDLRKVVLEEELKSSQKISEIESIRNNMNELQSSTQQEVMQLKFSLQKSDDEKLLYKHDLERYEMWVKELQQNGKALTTQLQREKKKSKSLSENAILNEAKVARFSTRMSGYKRAAMTQTKLSPRSTLADLTLELDSSANSSAILQFDTKPDSLNSSVEEKPAKDDFDNLLKETAAELEKHNIDGNISLNSSLDKSPHHPFEISSFDAS